MAESLMSKVDRIEAKKGSKVCGMSCFDDALFNQPIKAKKKTFIKKKDKNEIKVKKPTTKLVLSSFLAQRWPISDKNTLSSLKLLLKKALTEFQGTKSVKGKCQLKPYVDLGYNAVMKSLEKDKLVCVFANFDATPDFLCESFIPICYKRNVPLIQISCLSELAQETTGIQSVLTLGLTKSVCVKSNAFRDFHLECFRHFNFSHDCLLPDKATTSDQKPRAKSKNVARKTLNKKYEKDVFNYLIRCNKVRIFNPPKLHPKASKIKINENTPQYLTIDIGNQPKKKKEQSETVNTGSLGEAGKATRKNVNKESSESKKRSSDYIPAVVKKVKSIPRYFNEN